jgi:hypothetical protein
MNYKGAYTNRITTARIPLPEIDEGQCISTYKNFISIEDKNTNTPNNYSLNVCNINPYYIFITFEVASN